MVNWRWWQRAALGMGLFALGLQLLRGAGLISGGCPGLALLASRHLGGDIGLWLLVVTLPLLLLGLWQLGRRLTLRALLVTLTLALVTDLLTALIGPLSLSPLLAPLAGLMLGAGLSLLMGAGLTLAGFNLIALLLERRYRWHSARTLLLLDLAVLLLGAGNQPLALSLWSALVVVTMMTTLRLSYRPEPLALVGARG